MACSVRDSHLIGSVYFFKQKEIIVVTRQSVVQLLEDPPLEFVSCGPRKNSGKIAAVCVRRINLHI